MLTCIYISLNETYFNIQHTYGSIIYKYSMQNMFDAVHFGCLFRICNSIKSIVIMCMLLGSLKHARASFYQ